MSDLLNIGKHEGQQLFFDLTQAPNRHMLVLGRSGEGKTTFLQRTAIELAKQGKTVVLFDLHNIFADAQIFVNYRSEFQWYLRSIEVQNGISLPLMKRLCLENGETESATDLVEAVTEILATAVGLTGPVQRAILTEALEYVFRKNLYSKQGIAVLENVLATIGTPVAASVLARLKPLLSRNLFRDGEFELVPGRINVFRVGNASLSIQPTIMETLMAYMFRLSVANVFQKQEIFLLLDEFQNLPHGGTAMLTKMLLEGRKYNLNVVLATQQAFMAGRKLQKIVSGCGLKVYFHPDSEQIQAIAKEIAPMQTAKAVLSLNDLEIGEFIAFGALSVEGVKRSTATSGTIREEAIYE